MQSKLERLNPTEIKLTVEANTADLKPVLDEVMAEFAKQVTVAGFRPGKAPAAAVEREVGTNRIQSEVIEHAAGRFYTEVANKEKLRPLEQPHVEVVKFVAYSELVMVYSLEIFPEIKLPNYKTIKKAKPIVKISAKEIDDVINSLRSRSGRRQEVKRATKDGDEVILDMVGMSSGQEVAGTRAADYTVLVGSNQFVPGFESALIGLKAGDKKDFDVTFPKDYAEAGLRGQKVSFSVTIKRVLEITLPKIDDDFAEEVGPFKNLAELKDDIKKQIQSEKDQQANRELADSLVIEISQKAKFELPKRLVAKQQQSLVAHLEADLKRQGVELVDYLKQQSKTQADLDIELQKQAEERIRTALVLSEIAKAEGLKVDPAELEVRIQVLKGQYQDPKAQEELEKPSTRQEIADQILVEKTVSKLVGYATKN